MKEYQNKEILNKLYIQQSKTCREIASLYKVHETTVLLWIKRYGFKTYKGGVKRLISVFENKDYLYVQYIVNKKSLSIIAKEHNCNPTCVRNWIKKHVIQLRTTSEALKGLKKPEYMRDIFRERAKKQFGGKKNWNWKGGVTSKHHSFRTSIAYRNWQHKVWKRDNYICALCNSWKKPNAHHILPLWYNWQERLNINNGITLCKKCHESIKGKELAYFLLFALLLLKKRVNSGKPRYMGNPEPNRLFKNECRAVQRLLEKDKSFLMTSKNALHESEEIVQAN